MRQSLSGVVVIFDLDGTLIDTAADLAAAMNHALASDGLETLPPETVRYLVGQGAKAMLREGYNRRQFDLEDGALDQRVEIFLAYYTDHIADQSRPFPDIIEEIDLMRGAGAQIAICTNKREAPAQKLIKTLGLTDRFEAIIGSDTTIAPKPHPAPVYRCLEATGCERAVFIGDSDTDIKAAAAVGLPIIAVDFGYGPLDLRKDATMVMSAYSGLGQHVQRLADAQNS